MSDQGQKTQQAEGQITVSTAGKVTAVKNVSASKAEGALKEWLNALNARITELETETKVLRKAIKNLGGNL